MSVTINSYNIQSLSQQFASMSSGPSLYSQMKGASASTWNGASSYSIGNHDPRVVLFSKSVRGMDMKDPEKSGDKEKYLEFLLDECAKVSLADTVRMIFHIRDCRGGKGEKKIFYGSMRWMISRHENIVRNVIQHIPHYGSWKDVWKIFLGTCMEDFAINFYAQNLRKNISILDTADAAVKRGEKPNYDDFQIGIGKYAPSEKTAFDRKHKVVEKLCRKLGCTPRHYRKSILRRLRSARLTIVEELMCAKKWTSIDYEAVPSVASHMYRKAFAKRDTSRYAQYLEEVKKGTKKINASCIDPCTLIKSYETGLTIGGVCRVDDTVEAQWNAIVSKLKSDREGNPLNILPICDVSGSMMNGACSVRPIHASVSMSILLALTNSSPFERLWLNFSDAPTFQKLKGETLCEMVSGMDKQNWGMTTNLQSVFDILLQTAQMYNTPAESMPSSIVIISDMQFNSCVKDRTITNWDAIERKYHEAGYNRPTIIFWNVNSATVDMPVPDSNVPNCILISGFNTSTFNLILNNKIPNPLDVVREVIDSERYQRIVIDDESLC